MAKQSSPQPISPEQPLVWLGLAGFSVAQRAAVESALASWHAAGGLPWRLSPFQQADAWMIHGAKARLATGQTLRVQPAALNERMVQIDLQEPHRPMAFARPLSAAYVEHPLTFDLDQPTQIVNALGGLELALAETRTDFALGASLVTNADRMQKRCYALLHPRRGELARINLALREVLVHPSTLPHEVPQAQWSLREDSVASTPTDWRRSTPARLRWIYADRSLRDLLPARYRQRTVYLRHPPNVPARWLRDAHLAVLRELTLGPGTLAELERRTGVDDAALAHALATLFQGNAITTTPERAGPGSGVPGSREGEASRASNPEPLAAGGIDPTAPAPLGLR